LLLKTDAGKRPRALDKAYTLFTFILTFFLKGNSYEFHVTLVLFCKQGRTAEVTICRHENTSLFQNLIAVVQDKTAKCEVVFFSLQLS
jgi:hypothetical protein